MIRLICYLLILVLAYVFTYLFNLDENYKLLYMMAILPFADYIYLSIVKNKCKIDIIKNKDLISRGEDNKYSIVIKNNSKISISFVDYSMNTNGKFIGTDVVSERVSVDKEYYNDFYLKGNHVGQGKLIINKLEIRSIFGFFKTNREVNIESETSIIPNYVNIQGMAKVLELGGGLDLDDEMNNNLFQGEPGYEYKEYVEGDPLNRVNWKLSSKQNELMVRKSVSSSKLTKLVLLDYGIEEDKQKEDNIDIATETYLSIVSELVKREYEVGVLLKNHAFKEYYLENEQDVEDLRAKLCNYEFSISNENRFAQVDEEVLKSSDLIIVTVKKDKYLSDYVTTLEKSNIDVFVVSNSSQKIFNNEAYINEKYVLERI